MIDPASLDLFTLPWIPLSSKSKLPQQSAIYFAIDSLGTVQYIGQAKNLRQRWGSHEKNISLKKTGGVRIAYLIADEDLLDSEETALIAWFDPPLNKIKPGVSKKKNQNRNGITIRLIKEVEISGLGALVKKARLESSKSLEEICHEVGFSRTYWYDLEKETLKGALSLENLRKVEQVLEIDFGVSFDA